DADFCVRLLDSRTQTPRAVLRGHTHSLTAVTFSGDGSLVASSALDRTIRLWDSVTGTEKATWKTGVSPSQCLAFSPDGRILAAGADEIDRTSSVDLWDVRTGQVRHLADHRWTVRALAFLDGGKTLVSVSGDSWGSPGEVKLWDVAAGRELSTAMG